MRIISGAARGRHLLGPKDRRIRPTADRIKESLFNILNVRFGKIEGLRVLDIFAGTGNLGLEALSRGAASAVFIDNHRESVALIRKNIEICGFSDRSRVIPKDAVPALHILSLERIPFDLVFLDPPYEKGLAAETLRSLAASGLLDDASVVIAELSSREQTPEAFGVLREYDRRTYGDTVISFYSTRAEGEKDINLSPQYSTSQE